MLLPDKGKPTKYSTIRKNYYIIIDDERMTARKLRNNLGFYSIVSDGLIKEEEVVYDTDKKLLTGVGLVLRKKLTPQRAYFSLVRINNLTDSYQLHEKKSFLGECERDDQPSDFPVQIADAVNNIFNNVFTINLVDVVKHCTPYIKIGIGGNKYKIVSGTGYEVVATFENLVIRDMRTGRKGEKRIFSLEMEDDPDYEREREHIEAVIARYCKELVPVIKNRFEIAETLVRAPVIDKAEEKKRKLEEKKKRKEKKKAQEEEF